MWWQRVRAPVVYLAPVVLLARCVRRGGVPVQATYPLDTLRLRLAVDPGSRSVRGAAAALMREGSHGAFFRGLGASLVGALRTLCSPGMEVLWGRHHPLFWVLCAARAWPRCGSCQALHGGCGCVAWEWH